MEFYRSLNRLISAFTKAHVSITQILCQYNKDMDAKESGSINFDTITENLQKSLFLSNIQERFESSSITTFINIIICYIKV